MYLLVIKSQPLYIDLNMYLRKISELGVLEDMRLRNGDYFRELEASYNEAVSTIRESEKKRFRSTRRYTTVLKQYFTNRSGG